MSKHVIFTLLVTLLLISAMDAVVGAGTTSAKDLFAPVFVNRPGSLYYSRCDTARYTFQAVSAATGLPSIWVRYRLISGPGSIDSVTGEWKLPPTHSHDSLGTFQLEVGASEFSLSTEGLQNCQVPITVDDYLPLPRPYPTVSGQSKPWQVNVGVLGLQEFRYSTTNQCDSVHTFLAGISPGFVGDLSYQDLGGRSILSCIPDSEDAGCNFTIRIGCTDDLDTTFLGFPIAVPDWPSYKVTIKAMPDQIQGKFVEVPVVLESHPLHLSLGGFDLLMAWDNSALSLQGVRNDSSALYYTCKWEYFTYRFGANGNCGSNCPGGLVRVIGLAETNNGTAHPVCAPYFLPQGSTELFRMTFLTTNNRTFAGAWVPIRFYWVDCGDNTLSTYGGSQLSLEETVWDRDTAYCAGGMIQLGELHPVDSSLATLPGYAGIPSGVCGENAQYPIGVLPPVRRIDFYNGGIGFICPESIDAGGAGDINLNSLAYELSDYVMFENYFLFGDSAFGSHVALSLANSDINFDGVRAELADLVYMWRVVVGDALPYPKGSSNSSLPKDTISLTYVGGVVNVQTGTSLGALRLVFRGDVVPTSRSTYFTALYIHGGDSTVVLVVPSPNVRNNPGFSSGIALDISSDSAVSLVSATSATIRGARVVTLIDAPTDVNDRGNPLPGQFALYPNYPNPFNPETNIKFDLPKGSDVSLEILNILGQVVWKVSGHYTAGTHQISWRGTSTAGNPVSSGVYYYRLSAGYFRQTRKMVLLK